MSIHVRSLKTLTNRGTLIKSRLQLSRDIRFPTMWKVRPAKPQISLRIRAVCPEPCLWVEYSMIVELLIEHHSEFLSLIGGCTDLSESTLVKMRRCWKSHVTAKLIKETSALFLSMMIAQPEGRNTQWEQQPCADL